MIPVEIGKPFLCQELYDPTHNHQNMATHLDLLPELRVKAQIRNLAAKQRAARKYNANLCLRLFIKVYRLEHLSGEEIPNTWNVSHLKFYFS